MIKIEELEKQVAEMKATIEAMKAEEAKPKKLEFKYSEKCYLLEMSRVDDGSGSTNAYIKHGRYRITKQGAEQSLARNKRANRLEALAEQLGGLKDFVKGEESWFIFFNWYNEEYVSSCTIGYPDPEKVYMTKECAVKICRMLNEGEFEL